MPDDSRTLANRPTDYLVSTLKGTLGAIPCVGSALAEIVGVIIPNQRIDRIADFAEKLSKKVSSQEAELIQKRIIVPEGVDIVEEALWQSARALTADRREYIAALVKNGLTKEQVNLLQTKKLLLLLSQLDDLEIVLLRYYADVLRQDSELEGKFREALHPVPAWIGAPQEQLDQHAISENMRGHLVNLGLLRPTFSFVQNGKLPEFDANAGRFKNSGYDITLLGGLLLRVIDFHPDETSDTA